MIKSKLEWFITKRAVIILCVLTILSLLLLKNKMHFLIGLLFGWSLSLIRFYLMGVSMKGLFTSDGRGVVIKSMSRYVLNQALAFLLFAVTAKISIQMLFGAMAGLMAVPMVVCINSITEGLALTHNNFEQKGVENGRVEE